MKKGSTVAAKASKKISQQKATVGLDLGDRNSWYQLPTLVLRREEAVYLFVGLARRTSEARQCGSYCSLLPTPQQNSRLT